MNWSKYKCQFPNRHSQISGYIEAGSSVLDVGCADMHLKSLLKPNCKYEGLDFIKRKNCIQCDLNSDLIKLDKIYDVVVFCGVLEYVNDIDVVLSWINKYSNKIIITYSTLEGYGRCLKNKNPELNLLWEDEILTLIVNNGFTVDTIETTSLNQKLYVCINSK